MFTALHQALGRQPGPIGTDMLDEAVESGIQESDALDWKRELPNEKALAQSDLVKDIAAFANSGGGVLVFGIIEEQRRAVGRVDVGDVTESYERTLRRVAVSGVQPPVVGLDVIRLGEEGRRALVVVVPQSLDLPHLIYRGEYFGAPIRNHADTEWMRERQLETLYRQRGDARRHSDEAVQSLYDELLAGRDTDRRAWMAIVAYPRVPLIGRQLDLDQARTAVKAAERQTMAWVRNPAATHAISAVNTLVPRRGMRRWMLTHSFDGVGGWYEAWFGLHDNGAVSLACGIGAHKIGGPDACQLPGGRITARNLEAAVSDTMALLRQAARVSGATGEYDLLLGIEWSGDESLVIEVVDWAGYRYDRGSVPIGRFAPIRLSVRIDLEEEAYLAQVAEVALDAINQGGVQDLASLPMPE